VILAGKGRPLVPAEKPLSTWYVWPRGRHSEKPDAFYDLVESVSPGPYLELFARRQRLGWETWGDEALEHVHLGATA
jgi:N6-adenosine-specific RNA methylase IME4